MLSAARSASRILGQAPVGARLRRARAARPTPAPFIRLAAFRTRVTELLTDTAASPAVRSRLIADTQRAAQNDPSHARAQPSPCQVSCWDRRKDPPPDPPRFAL